MSSWLQASPPPVMDAGRVSLRRLKQEDAEDIARLVTASLDHLAPWMPWAQQALSVEEEQAFIQSRQKAREERTDFGYAVMLSNGEPTGGAGLHTRHGPGTLEIGYWIATGNTRRGYATAASRALTEAAFRLPDVERVEIYCDEANRASAAVPVKLGFRLVEVVTRAPTAPAETGRRLIWAVTKAEWEHGSSERAHFTEP